MNIQLCNTTSPQRKIYKTLTEGITKNITFKNDEDVVNPTVLLTYQAGIDRYNYAYIEQLHRYYWISSIKEVVGRMCEIQLKCDVLMTYKEYIMNQDFVIKRRSGSGSTMIPDSNLPLNPYRDMRIIKFPNSFFETEDENSQCFVLTVAGK